LVLDDTVLFNSQSAAFGAYAVSIGVEVQPIAHCLESTAQCLDISTSLHSRVYLLTADSVVPFADSAKFGYVFNVSSSSVLPTANTARNVSRTCSQNEIVEFFCAGSETYGPDFSENVTCLSGIPDNSEVKLQCPVYDLTPSCATNGTENIDCIAIRESDGTTTCSCRATVVHIAQESFASATVDGYSEIILNNKVAALLSTKKTSDSKLYAPTASNAVSGQSGNLSVGGMSTNMMMILIPLQILLCCCLVLCCIVFACRRGKKDDDDSTEASDNEVLNPYVGDETEFGDDDSEAEEFYLEELSAENDESIEDNNGTEFLESFEGLEGSDDDDDSEIADVNRADLLDDDLSHGENGKADRWFGTVFGGGSRPDDGAIVDNAETPSISSGILNHTDGQSTTDGGGSSEYISTGHFEESSSFAI